MRWSRSRSRRSSSPSVCAASMGRLATAVCLCVCAGAVAAAQPYPNRPLRLLTPYGAGGSYDALARVMASKLGEQLGQQVIVDNRPGAAGRIGMALGVKMPADGHNIILIGNSQAVAPSVYATVPYDLAKDLDYLSLVGTITNVLVAHPSVAAHSVQELVALSKAKP